jgi:hypothetical protein
MMKILVTLVLSAVIFNGFSQNIYVPDNVFEGELIDLGLDDVMDDSVFSGSIDTVLALHLNTLAIESLEGIEGFLALEFLECKNNILTELDVSSNTNLKFLSCELNYLTDLNLEGIEALEALYCDDNELTSLDLTEHTELEYLLCGRNPLIDLDLSTNDSLVYLEFRIVPSIIEMDLSDKPNLREVYCDYNENLIHLNLANGMPDSFDILHAEETPNLTCIEVDDPAISETDWTNYFTETKTFSTFCGLSLTEVNVEVLVRIYPIPTEDYINIAVNNNSLTYKLLDLTGKLIEAGKLTSGENRINVQEFNTGVYFLQVDGQEHHSTHKTIIK